MEVATYSFGDVWYLSLPLLYSVCPPQSLVCDHNDRVAEGVCQLTESKALISRDTHPSSYTCLSLFGTTGRHHSNRVSEDFALSFFPAPWDETMRHPSKSKAATFDLGSGARLIPWRHVFAGPRAGAQEKAECAASGFKNKENTIKGSAPSVSGEHERDVRLGALLALSCVLGSSTSSAARLRDVDVSKAWKKHDESSSTWNTRPLTDLEWILACWWRGEWCEPRRDCMRIGGSIVWLKWFLTRRRE